jgi:hypothetical protein
MKKILSWSRTTVIALVILAELVFLPVSGLVSSVTTQSPLGSNGAVPDAISAATPANYVAASVTTGSPVVGDPVTIFGTVAGDSLPANVQIWVFAGNYVNVSNVPVNTAGFFSKTYTTTGLPPATYYVFVESPGSNGNFNIDLAETGIFSGQVVNTATNTLIFNLTGTGSLKNANASQALSEALNDPGVDDIYTKLTFQLTAPSTEPTTITPANTPTTPAKSPVTVEITGLALIIGGLGISMYRRT